MSPSLESRETRAHAVEMKFVVPTRTADDVRHWARRMMLADPHGDGDCGDEYRTTSLYFDTPSFDVLERRGSHGRMKFRVRRYGDAPVVYVERKLRNARMLNKRRTAVPLADLDHLLASPAAPSLPAGWFQRRIALRSLAPVCQISYLRTARVLQSTHGSIRLTVDRDIRVAPVTSCVFAPERGAAVLAGYEIVELKYLWQTPAIFKQLAEEFLLQPMSLSKYRLGASAIYPITDPAVSVPVLSRAS